jgi:NitT/TauT family transport system substrate-binding protein
MDLVRQFCFSHGLLGEKTKSADDIGIQFTDGSVLGNSAKVRLRFNNTFMQLAAQGKL